MKKIFFGMLLVAFGLGKSQSYASINTTLERLEKEEYANTNTELFEIEGKKFILMKDFADHSERHFLEIRNNQSTVVLVNDDKKSGEIASKIYSGDVLRRKNVVSVRLDHLEKKQIGMPLTYTFVLNYKKNIWYLIDTATGERWIESVNFEKK